MQTSDNDVLLDFEHHVTKLIHLDSDRITCIYPACLDEASEQDNMALFEAKAACVAGSGEPEQGLKRVAHDECAASLPDWDAIDLHPSHDGGQIAFLPVCDGRAQYAASVKKIICDEGFDA